jgi:hypothetical protein
MRVANCLWAAAVFGSVALACSAARAAEVYAAPDGKAGARGTKDSPIDLTTAFANAKIVTPGTVVWILPGTYEVGQLRPAPEIRGTKEKPVVYRAAPGRSATLVGEILPANDHVWFWGLDIQGGFNIRGGDGLKLINLTIHEAGPPEKPKEHKPSGQGIGGWDVGNDHEFYGNIIYHNGWNRLDHGIYSQNTAKHSVKRYVDNIVFENAGFGLHLYGQSPVLSGFHVEGNIAFATSLGPRGPGPGEVNILIGGSKPLSRVALKSNCTYHPQVNSKRGVDIGYHGAPNTDIHIEDNYFVCGANALDLKGIAEATVRNNTFWAPGGMVTVGLAPVDKPKVVFEGNTYIDNGKFDLARFREQIGSGETDKVVPGKNGRPAGLHVFKRINQYEPERIHLAVYNWDHEEVVRIGLQGVLSAGDAYRVVNVLDFFGPAVVEGKAKGPFVDLPMKGHRYEPEFGAYVLFRTSPG